MKLRFSIRDLLWLTLVVALATAWGIDHWKLTSQRNVLEYNVELLTPYAKGSSFIEDFLADGTGRLQVVPWNPPTPSFGGGEADPFGGGSSGMPHVTPPKK